MPEAVLRRMKLLKIEELKSINESTTEHLDQPDGLKECIVVVNYVDENGNKRSITYKNWFNDSRSGDFQCYNFALMIQRQYDPSRATSTLKFVQ
ncbi:hypothetical protein MG290_02325 [Flavobacterium sp. CBA20B-1]|uniref:hypothetical protein n=1 Tax=unclassified Flavobacterium TaxID=196869 RepID=UPI0022255AAC|nr:MULTISPECIES: hypothetical protein [unclassified Flavobacterium]WCM42530.1 hypothetical protein MG290_02325 [Flavobacterium sp. CBA20B-1]